MREWNCGPGDDDDDEDDDDLDATGLWQLPASVAFDGPDTGAAIEEAGETDR